MYNLQIQKQARTKFDFHTPPDAANYGTLDDFQFFDKVRRAFKNDDVYDNFLRCLAIYNQELVSKTDLIDMMNAFLRLVFTCDSYSRQFYDLLCEPG